jgi:hypothetical protein
MMRKWFGGISDIPLNTEPLKEKHIKVKIKYTVRKIHQLVYQLYELTDDKIKIVEG